MHDLTTWATTDEILAAAHIFKVPLYIWTKDGVSGWWWLKYGGGSGPPAMYLKHSGTHFNVVQSV